MKVDIYGADWCKPCQNAKKLCESNNVEYTFNDVSADPEALAKLTKILGTAPNTIPHIVVDGEYIGGSSEFIILMEKYGEKENEQSE